jgi:Fic family protein
MEHLMEPNRLRSRIIGWAEAESASGALPAKATLVLEAVLFRGELARGDVEALLETSERTARRVTSALLERGALTSESSRAPLKLAFPAALASTWMPGLFPAKSQ